MSLNFRALISLLLFWMTFITPAAAQANPANARAAPIRLLIIDGFSNHNWQATTQGIRRILEPTGLFDFRVVTTPDPKDPDQADAFEQWNPTLADAEVILINCNDINRSGCPFGANFRAQFEAWVAAGGGVFVWHSANNAFPDWPAWNEMIGLGWRQSEDGPSFEIDPATGEVREIPRGQGERTAHGDRHEVLVHSLGQHPIHQGLPATWLTPGLEVYTHPRGPAQNLEILSWGLDAESGRGWPLEWTTRYGQGRVYSSTFGHVWRDEDFPPAMRCLGMQTLAIRACQWLAGRDPNWPLPANFPTAEAVSLAPEAR